MRNSLRDVCVRIRLPHRHTGTPWRRGDRPEGTTDTIMDAQSLALAIGALVGGLVILIWSADRFVDGASASARHLGLSPLLIGMVIVGFGTSAPEMVVSLFASLDGNPGIALGNAYGSNIANIALILGITALVSPIAVSSSVIRLELPILLGVTAITGVLLYSGSLSQLDGVILLGVFGVYLGWSFLQNAKRKSDPYAAHTQQEIDSDIQPLKKAILWTIAGLLLLIVSSRMIVWGAVEIATMLGVDNLIIGLTIVALGTSLPELASTLAAVRKNEHEIALGNIIGSNLFNTLIVVGIAAVVAPMEIPHDLLTRDFPVMAGLTMLLLVLVFRFKSTKRLSRFGGGLLVLIFAVYTAYLVMTVV